MSVIFVIGIPFLPRYERTNEHITIFDFDSFVSSFSKLILHLFNTSIINFLHIHLFSFLSKSIFTDDDELKQNVAMVLPYCAIGNLTLTLGSLSWTLVGAQGRYNVATFHGCVGRYVMFTLYVTYTSCIRFTYTSGLRFT